MKRKLDYGSGKQTFLESVGKEAIKGVGTGLVKLSRGQESGQVRGEGRFWT